VRNSSFMLCVVALVIAAATGYFIASKKCSSPIGHCVSEKRCALRTGMRKLWADHVFWTRDYIIAGVAGAGDAQAASQRLMQNQEDIGNAIIPYYGKEAGLKLTALLKEHIAIAADIVSAAKLNQAEKVTELDTKWHNNAKEIAAFLSNANSNWPEADLVSMLNAHLKLTTEELKARLASNWKDDIAAFDKIFAQIMDMADQLTNGIVAQFPKKF
jgi:hypothetical protein